MLREKHQNIYIVANDKAAVLLNCHITSLSCGIALFIVSKGWMTPEDTGGQAYLQVKALSAIWHLGDIITSSVCSCPYFHL